MDNLFFLFMLGLSVGYKWGVVPAIAAVSFTYCLMTTARR